MELFHPIISLVISFFLSFCWATMATQRPKSHFDGDITRIQRPHRDATMQAFAQQHRTQGLRLVLVVAEFSKIYHLLYTIKEKRKRKG